MNDDERLSALFEGRVVGRERDELLAHLAASDDDYEVFTDTAEVLRALEEEDALAVAASASAPDASPGVADEARTEVPGGALAETSGVLPFRRPERANERKPVRWWPALAAAAVILLVSTVALQGRGDAGQEPLQLAARLDAGLPAGWTQPWDGERGESSNAERDARAVRTGVMLTQLAVAVETRDTERTATLATQIIERFASGSGAIEPLERIASQPGAPVESLRELVEEATEGLEKQNRPAWLRLGAWAEAARLAARQQNPAFFRDRETDAMLRRAERLTRDDADARAAVTRVRAAIPAEGQPVSGELEPSLHDLLREITS